MCPFNTGDCLIEVTAWTGLTVVVFLICYLNLHNNNELMIKKRAKIKYPPVRTEQFHIRKIHVPKNHRHRDNIAVWFYASLSLFLSPDGNYFCTVPLHLSFSRVYILVIIVSQEFHKTLFAYFIKTYLHVYIINGIDVTKTSRWNITKHQL